MYDAVVFDLDGVILDSGINNFRWMDRVRRKKASQLGYEFTEEDSMQIVEASSHEQIEELLERKGMRRAELLEIEQRVQNAKIELIEHGVIQLFDQAEQIISDLDRPVGLATNSPKRIVEFTLRYYGIEGLFDTVQSLKHEDFYHYVDNRKPDPLLVENAVEELEADSALMLGDTAKDVEAANRAGITSGLVHAYTDHTEADPDIELRNISELRSVLTQR